MNTRSPISSIFTLLISSAALALTAAACSSSDDNHGGPGGGGGNYTLDDVCEKMAAQQCASLKSCCESSGIGYDEAGCIASARTGCDEEVALVKAGKRTFHPEVVNACASALSTFHQKCELSREDLTTFGIAGIACQQVFAGSTEEGGACEKSADCKPPAGANEFATCPSGKCKIGHVDVAEGGDCDPASTCAAGLYCQSEPGAGIENALTGKCQKAKQVGEACSSNAYFRSECGEGNHCELGSGICKVGKGVGEDCMGPLECQSLACEQNKCAEETKYSMADEESCKGETDGSGT